MREFLSHRFSLRTTAPALAIRVASVPEGPVTAFKLGIDMSRVVRGPILHAGLTISGTAGTGCVGLGQGRLFAVAGQKRDLSPESRAKISFLEWARALSYLARFVLSYALCGVRGGGVDCNTLSYRCRFSKRSGIHRHTEYSYDEPTIKFRGCKSKNLQVRESLQTEHTNGCLCSL